MKKYPKMKPSGVKWIGDVPEHWGAKKLKYFAEIKLGKMLTPDDKGGFLLKPYLRAQNLQWFKADLNDVKEMWFSEKEMETYRVEKDDLLVSEGGEVGRTCIWGNEIKEVYIQNSVNKVAVKGGGSAKFYLYCFSSCARKGYFDAMVNRVSIAHLTKEKLKEVEFPFPQPTEQTAIAHYLDRKTAQIDQAISEKERLIELFREERQAIINHAVTKGIRAGVKMKASGVEWIGDVPEGWAISKLKYIKSEIKNAFVDGPFGSNLKSEHYIDNGEVYVIDSGFVTSGEFVNHREFRTITLEHFQTIQRSECKENDIIISKIGANFGMSGILPKLDKPSVVSGNSLKLTVNTKLFDLKFIHYQLQNQKQNGEIDLLVKGSAQPALSLGLMNSLPILIPTNIEEQLSIVAFLNEKTTQIDTAISGIQQEIALLQEYRQALIFEAVTGKVCVI